MKNVIRITAGIVALLMVGGAVFYFTFNEDPVTPDDQPPLTSTAPMNGDWWQPSPGDTWQWQLSGTVNTSYDTDIYDIDLEDTAASTISSLQDRGIKVICYFSAGSWEAFRDDADSFPAEALGDVLDGWPDERWLDVAHYELFSDAMEARMDMAVDKGCDAVEPDNVDGYQNDTGFGFTAADQLAYNIWLSQQAHARGLGIGLKNDLDQVEELVGHFDFAVNEQCFQYSECDMLTPFIDQAKAVLGVEYELDTDEFCDQASAMQFSWLKMEYELDGGRIGCE